MALTVRLTRKASTRIGAIVHAISSFRLPNTCTGTRSSPVALAARNRSTQRTTRTATRTKTSPQITSVSVKRLVMALAWAE